MNIGVWTALFGATVAAAPIPLRPIPWQEPAPLGRLFLQQPFEAPQPEPGLSMQFISANLFMKGGRPGGFEYTVDEEIGSVSFTPQVVIGDRVGLSLTVPLIVQYGGWLDPVIDGVEKLFNARAARRGSKEFQTFARFSTADGRVLEQVGPAASLGDVTAGARWLLVKPDGLRPGLALRAALKAPTGGPLTGSGTWDVGVGVLGSWEVRFFAAHVAFDVAVPSGRLEVLEIPTRPYGSIQFGFGFRTSDTVALHLQLSGHTAPLRIDDAPGMTGTTLYILAGVEWQGAPGTALALSGVENYLSPGRGADFSVLLGLRLSLGGTGHAAPDGESTMGKNTGVGGKLSLARSQ